MDLSKQSDGLSATFVPQHAGVALQLREPANANRVKFTLAMPAFEQSPWVTKNAVSAATSAAARQPTP